MNYNLLIQLTKLHRWHPRLPGEHLISRLQTPTYPHLLLSLSPSCVQGVDGVDIFGILEYNHFMNMSSSSLCRVVWPQLTGPPELLATFMDPLIAHPLGAR